ncbi:hypothetical protein [Halobacteriovorax sp. HLS]|uniref:hypothetical protein n=1 Tax=Halobacteriovorax sp. HLS TaxID=2234000 RepID=UPI000FDC485B|nr:hypothetical protein [Halobacteriovorax sp. HLS]
MKMIKMEEYLKESEFAINAILAAIWHEHAELESIKVEMSQLFKVNWESQGVVFPDNLSTGKIVVTGKRPVTFYSQEEELLYDKRDEARDFEYRIIARQFSVDALSGTLLQFAKQGISVVHNGVKSCPDGRRLGSQSLKTIIWEGRNQSLHWEGETHKPVRMCFKNLVREFGLQFAHYNAKNLGFAVINFLNWRKFSDFEADMLSLK